MSGGFRANIFDPVLVVAQIVAMQCSFYTFMGLWIVLSDLIGGIQPSVDQILDYRVRDCMLVCVCVCTCTNRRYFCMYNGPSSTIRSLVYHKIGMERGYCTLYMYILPHPNTEVRRSMWSAWLNCCTNVWGN